VRPDLFDRIMREMAQAKRRRLQAKPIGLFRRWRLQIRFALDQADFTLAMSEEAHEKMGEARPPEWWLAKQVKGLWARIAFSPT
jgi:hypothetical protein